MNNTIHTIEWQGENGMIRLEAKYQADLQEKINNLDGDICPTGKLEIVERASLTAYFNDKRLDDSWNLCRTKSEMTTQYTLRNWA